MGDSEVLKTRIAPQLKLQAKAIADRELLSEAAWLKRLVVREIRSIHGAEVAEQESSRPLRSRHPARDGRGPGGGRRPVYVRLSHEDRLLLDARAAARGMRPATYVAILTRSHLRRLAPLPKEEYLTLRRTVAELASIGRNLNQIAKAANNGGRLPVSAREEFRGMLRICEALRDNTRALLNANITSWEIGHEEDI